MSSTTVSDLDAISSDNPIMQAESPAPRRSGVWTWTVIACVLLGFAGIVRTIQDRRHQEEGNYKETCPIDMDKLPEKLGVWHMVSDSEKKLDDKTMLITGGTDHKIRTYADDLTGVSVVVLLLYGPAVPVLPHTPDVCYPSSGFDRGDPPIDQLVSYSVPGVKKDEKALFRSATYQKGSSRGAIREAVYHSFRLDGQWSPYIGMNRKFPRRNPGIFKLQVQRLVAEGEIVAKGDPIEQFLSSLVTEIEKEIKDGKGKQVTQR